MVRTGILPMVDRLLKAAAAAATLLIVSHPAMARDTKALADAAVPSKNYPAAALLSTYILEGEITVDYGAKGKRTFRRGDALMEAMDVPHFGENTGTAPMRLIAVYMGAKGAEDVVPVK
jgi:uncharacterized RmlC-like cupin family protein